MTIARRLIVVVVAATAPPAWATDLQGRVLSGDSPLPGAMVTAAALNNIETTVYSDAAGSFRFDRLPAGSYSVRARALGYDDATLNGAGGADGADASAPLMLKLQAAQDWRLQAPSSSWLGLLPDGPQRRKFITNCDTCHEVAASRVIKDGAPRDEARWTDAIKLMKSIDVYAMVPPAFDTTRNAHWLAENLSAARIAGMQRPAAPPPPAGTVITEYPMPEADELPHDVAMGPDGRLWITAFWHSQVWALDPASGAIERFDVSTDKTQPAQVRALAFDRQGALWVILGGSKSLVRLDPKTRAFKTFPVGMYAHDLVIDSKGDVWVNDYFSKPERIGKLTVATGEVSYYPLPSSNLPEAEGKPLPYGLQIDAQDRLWSTQLSGNTLVRFDTRTGTAKLYPMPEPDSGPRRHAVARDGSVWIPEFNDGFLDRFDPDTERFDRYDLGDSTIGAYDVAVNPVDGSVWITGSLENSLLRFDPRTHAIERYPLPTQKAFMRHLSIDPRDGAVWSAYSSLPTAVPKAVRLVRGVARP